jgi:hypothetical protein
VSAPFGRDWISTDRDDGSAFGRVGPAIGDRPFNAGAFLNFLGEDHGRNLLRGSQVAAANHDRGVRQIDSVRRQRRSD